MLWKYKSNTGPDLGIHLLLDFLKSDSTAINDTLLQFPEFVRFLINRGEEFNWLKKQVRERSDYWQSDH